MTFYTDTTDGVFSEISQYNRHMSNPKTVPTGASVKEFIDSIDDEQRRSDAATLLEVFSQATELEPTMWGESIVGYGTYHYVYKGSGHAGDWPLVAFSPRKANLTIYALPGVDRYQDLLEVLGKHTTSVSCVYFKKLSDVDTDVLIKLIRRIIDEMRRMYPSPQAK